ncbi:MAG TPA: pyridoxal-phosphate dependent enzyme [Thermoanaerobaculia bacterium]|jgi:threonine synthase|nr:pyridoxal-phosphate dependent enzyme [Thermoanaerobaculia bacterium]
MRTSITCGGCGYTLPPLDPRPFRCPNSGDGRDHVLVRCLDGIDRAPFFDREPNPFLRYRTFTHAWHTAAALGIQDSEFVALVRTLDCGFVETPLRAGAITVKDETSNVAGSHKARHLMGLMIWLKIAERIDPTLATAPLAIASCGNAALAAAVVARAAERKLLVFVPAEAAPSILARLQALGAHVTRCERRSDEAGDPALLRFREAVADGALPFTCQGTENGLVIEGGQTLGWEIASQLAAAGLTIDRLFIQVGGGALASAVIAGLEEAREAGVIARIPRIHAVQTEAVAPLRRAWECGSMSPWENPRKSIATGILDDETYDWVAVVRGMSASGGFPVIVSEEELAEAQQIAGENVSATGAAGLAGLLHLRVSGESQMVIFTGAA